MFKTFPNFSKLTLTDREEYEERIRGYPNVGDISFAALMTWWDELGHGVVSTLNENLIVQYWLPGDEAKSGLSLIGTNEIDQTLCMIFDHMKTKDLRPRLVNVPQFVVNSIHYPELFKIKSQRCFDEYIFDMSDFYPIENLASIWRHKIKKKLPTLENRKVEMKKLDLAQQQNRDFLLNALDQWQPKNINDYGQREREWARAATTLAADLHIENVGRFVDEELYGCCIYSISEDGHDLQVSFIKATHNKALGYELIMYLLAEWFHGLGVKQINLGWDCGLLRLRAFMLTLGPMNFFRKYTIEPN